MEFCEEQQQTHIRERKKKEDKLDSNLLQKKGQSSIYEKTKVPEVTPEYFCCPGF